MSALSAGKTMTAVAVIHACAAWAIAVVSSLWLALVLAVLALVALTGVLAIDARSRQIEMMRIAQAVKGKTDGG